MLPTRLMVAGGSVLTYIGTASAVEGDQSVTITVPVGAQTGDFLLAFGYSAGAGSLWSVTGGGWTITNAATTTAPRLTAMYRTHDGSASYTFNQNISSADIGVTLLVVRSGAFDVASSVTSSADPQTVPSVTAASSGSIQFVTAGGNSQSPDATPSGFTQLYLYNGGLQPNWGVYSKTNVAAGSTGTVTVSMTGSSNTASMQVIVKPL